MIVPLLQFIFAGISFMAVSLCHYLFHNTFTFIALVRPCFVIMPFPLKLRVYLVQSYVPLSEPYEVWTETNMLVLLFVALWFILRGELLYVFPCVILLLCCSVLLVLRLPRFGKRELILVLFVRLFYLCVFGFVCFFFLLGFGKGCGLWLWHSLDFSLTFFMVYYIT